MPRGAASCGLRSRGAGARAAASGDGGIQLGNVATASHGTGLAEAGAARPADDGPPLVAQRGDGGDPPLRPAVDRHRRVDAPGEVERRELVDALARDVPVDERLRQALRDDRRPLEAGPAGLR